jgi:hypothetical protein
LRRTVVAINKFYKSLRQTSFFGKIRVVNCFATDNLVSCLTPLIRGNGAEIWTNTNFISTDINADGLKGNTTSKSLATGINPSTLFASLTSVGATIYNTDAGASSGHMWGCADSGAYTNDFVGTHSLGATGVHFDSFNTGTGRILKTTGGFYTGFTSYSRLSATDTRIFYRKTGISVTEAGSIATSGGTCPNTSNFYVFASYNGSAAAFWTSARCSFIAWHDGLTIGETTIFCELIEAMRREMGGGAVAP